MENKNEKILTLEEEEALRKPFEEHVGEIQKEIDNLRENGTFMVMKLSEEIDAIKRDKIYSKSEKEERLSKLKNELEKAKSIELQNKEAIKNNIAKAESYLKEHFAEDYYKPVKMSCELEKKEAKEKYRNKVTNLKKEHLDTIAKLTDKEEIREEKYIQKNRLFDAKMEYTKNIQLINDRLHAAAEYRFHMLDLLKLSNFSFVENIQLRVENYRYTFDTRDFLLRNGLYIAIIIIFIALCIITPIVKNGLQLLTYNNILNILQQASPRMFLALGVAGLILLAGTDLSVGRMVGMGMTAATIIMHQGINTGSVFGHIFDFTGLPVIVRVLLALVVCVDLCTFFTTIIDPSIPKMIIPKINGFPTIILWAIAAILVVWFIWNKTTFGKNLYAVGGNPEAASVSGISVIKVTVGAFVLAGILYGFGSWLECIRMVGSGSAAYGQGWEMGAIAACVVGGVSFTGGIGKISGVVVGVFIFTALTYSLTILGIDTNLQFVFSGIIILVAVTLDCLKYVRKK